METERGRDGEITERLERRTGRQSVQEAFPSFSSKPAQSSAVSS